MDLFDENHHRAHSKRLFFGYGLMAILVLLSTWLLVLSAQGFRYDPSKGVTQNALLYVESKPLSARVFVDENSNYETTNAKFVLPLGDHNVKVEQDGYRTWSKKISLESQAVEFLNYIRLLPASITTSELVSLEQKPVFFETSPDDKWLGVGYVSTQLKVSLFDTAKPQEPPIDVSVAIPEALIGASVHFAEWSGDSNSMLVQFKGTKNDAVIINREQRSATFLSSLLDVNPSSISFANRDGSQLIALSQDGNALKISLRPTIQSSIISASVQAFHADDGEVALLRTNKDKLSELVHVSENNAPSVLATFTEAVTDPKLKIVKFDGIESVTIAANFNQAKQLKIYRNPITQLRNLGENKVRPTSSLRADSIDQLIVSPTGRFVGVYGASGGGLVFDQELQRLYRFTLGSAEQRPSNVGWYDDFLLAYEIQGRNFLVDFDGTNAQEVTSGLAGFMLKVTPDEERSFSLSQSVSGSFVLQSSKMIAD